MRAVRVAAILAAAVLVGAGTGLAPQQPVTDAHFGTIVVDPYRYMETEHDPAFLRWREAQIARTGAALAAIPGRAALESALRSASPSTKISNLTLVGTRAFFERTVADGTRIVVKDAAVSSERTIVDPGRLVASSGPLSVGAFAVSPDGRLLAFHADGPGVSDIRIVNVADGSLVEPPLRHTVFDAVGFLGDNVHVIYDATPTTSSGSSVEEQVHASRVYLHRIGAAQATDGPIFGTGVVSSITVPPSAFAFVDAPFGSTKAIAEVRDPAAIGSQFYVADQRALGSRNAAWRALGTPADAFTDYAVHGNTIELATQRGAANYRVVRASLEGPFLAKTILPPSNSVVVSGTLDGIPKAGIFALNDAQDATYVQVLERGIGRLRRIPYGSAPHVEDVRQPVQTSVLGVATDQRRPGALIDLTSWTRPQDVYAFNPTSVSLRALRVKPDAMDIARVAETIETQSADGTNVPVSLVYRKGLARDGTHPVLLRVIGAYGFSTTPDYDLVPDEWLALGGIFAVAHVRGGGEFGERWHAAGVGARKSNTWSDLIAVAELLVATHYTTPAKLDLYGPTASYLGGIGASIAIGRAITERPELFGAFAVDAPGFDMVRSEGTPVGKQSVPEFGSVATRAGFEHLLAMSPYEHVHENTRYPHLLARSLSRFGLGADWEAAKMVARLQQAAANEDAAYLDVVHDGPDDRRDRIASMADLYAFFLWQDGVAEFQPATH